MSERHTAPRRGVRSRYSGFTIVELLIVVVVIAILAAIVLVSYNGVRRSAIDSLVKDTAASLGKAMQTRRIESGLNEFEPTLPGAVKLADKVGAALIDTGDGTSFCINVTYRDMSSVYYSTRNDAEPRKELCEGAVVDASDDYNYEVGGGQPPADAWVTQPTALKVTAPGDMNFTGEVNDTWAQLKLSWKAMDGATLYRINQKDSASGTWYVRNPASGSVFNWDSTSYSGSISPSVTSHIWTRNIPDTLDKTYYYRIQYKLADGTWSDWNELSLSPMEGRAMPIIRNFKVTPNGDWSKATLSWDGLGNFAAMPGVKLRINQRDSASGTWYVRNPASGSVFNWNSASYSGSISPSVTSQDWTYNIPRLLTDAYEYRIQLYSGTATSEWSTFRLDPMQGASVPTPGNFKVTPNGDWSKITLSWDSLGDFANRPGVKIRINQRDSASGTWYVRNPASGSVFNWDSASYSGSISPSVTSQEWTGNIPPAGKTYEYRMQVYSGALAGDWVTFSLGR